jgi:hypothetical protein
MNILRFGGTRNTSRSLYGTIIQYSVLLGLGIAAAAGAGERAQSGISGQAQGSMYFDGLYNSCLDHRWIKEMSEGPNFSEEMKQTASFLMSFESVLKGVLNRSITGEDEYSTATSYLLGHVFPPAWVRPGAVRT